MKALLVGEYRQGKLLETTYDWWPLPKGRGRNRHVPGGERRRFPATVNGKLYLADVDKIRRVQPRGAQAAAPGGDRQGEPDLVVFSHSSYGWDLAPRVALALQAAQVSEVVDVADGSFRRPGLQRQTAPAA